MAYAPLRTRPLPSDAVVYMSCTHIALAREYNISGSKERALRLQGSAAGSLLID